jgi:hypothetical protein
LRRKNYEDLRAGRSLKVVLVVLELPGDEREWVECGVEGLVLRRCAWWESLEHMPDIQTDSRVVVVPDWQRFDLGGMSGLMDRVRRRVPLKERFV